MIKYFTGVDDICKFMNNLLEIDYDFVKKLCHNKIECNNKILDHESIQVDVEKDGKKKVTIVGLLNGFFGVDDKGVGPICYVEDKGKILEFKPTEEPKKISYGEYLEMQEGGYREKGEEK